MKKYLPFLLLLAAAFPLQAQRLRVAFVGDPQVDNETELAYARRSVYRELRERKDLDLTVFLGDLANDDVNLLAPSRATLDSLPFAWAWTRQHGSGRPSRRPPPTCWQSSVPTFPFPNSQRKTRWRPSCRCIRAS